MRFFSFATIFALSYSTTRDGTPNQINDGNIDVIQALDQRILILETVLEQQAAKLMKIDDVCTMVEKCDVKAASEERMSVMEGVIADQAIVIRQQALDITKLEASAAAEDYFFNYQLSNTASYVFNQNLLNHFIAVRTNINLLF